MMPEEWGLAGELEAAHWASLWGLPDLVYKAELTRNREPGDALLVNGLEGLIVQVKTRKGYGIDDAPEQITRWIDRKVKKAYKQFTGSRRMLTENDDIRGISLRDGLKRHFPRNIHWKGVVILVVKDDYLPQDIYPCGHKDIVAMTIQDWMQLCKSTRSVHGVITYVNRVTRDTPRMLEDICTGNINGTLPSYYDWDKWGELVKQESDIRETIDGLVVPLGEEYHRFLTFSNMDVREATKNGTLPFFRPPHPDISVECERRVDKVFEWIHADLSAMNGLKIRAPLGKLNIDRKTRYCREAIELLDKLPLSVKMILGSKMERIQEEAAKRRTGACDIIGLGPYPGHIIYVADSISNWSTGILDPEQRMITLAIDMFEALCLPDATDEPVLLLADIYNGRRKNIDRVCAFIGIPQRNLAF